MRFSWVELVFVCSLGVVLGLWASQATGDIGTLNSDSATLLSGFGGAVLGAGISALVSFLLAARTARDALERDAAERLDVEKAKIANLMIKGSLVLSDVVAIKKSIAESLQQANERNLTHLPRWARVLPMIGSPQIFDVDPNELAPLIRAKNNEMMNSVVTMIMQHRNLALAVQTYSEKRGALKDITDMHTMERPGVLSSGLTREQVGKLAPLEMELDSVLHGIEEMIPFVEKLAAHVTFDLGPAMRTYFRSDDIPIFQQGEPESSGPAVGAAGPG